VGCSGPEWEARDLIQGEAEIQEAPLNLNYSQSSGLITQDDGSHVALGWAGNHEGRNNPAMQDSVGLGPLPQGVYKIGPWGDHETVPGYPVHLGPMIASLTQIEGESFGRDGFFIHGPGGKDHLQSSRGCVEVPRPARNLVCTLTPGPDDTLTVKA
jgi:hypothetical protein